ncbi:MAG: polymer-forming cytoskeletal protein, partial [Pseudomonadota bacterium]
EEDLRIEGDVNGTVQLRNNTLTIGQEGKIRANVYAKSVTVDGLMEGDLFGSERVSIRGNAQVRGNITAPRVSLEDGARFKGSIEMDPQAVEAALGSTTSKAPAQKGARGGQGSGKSGGAKADTAKANGASQAASASAPAGAKAAASKDPL